VRSSRRRRLPILNSMGTQSALTPYLLNASAPPNWVDWAAAEASRSQRFGAEIDRLRRLAVGADRSGYARTTGPLTLTPYGELAELRQTGAAPQEQLPRAWKNTQLLTDDGLRHVRDYERGLRKTARTFLGTERAAPLLHSLVATTGYQLARFVGSIAAAPNGPLASTLAAHITGASWGSGATANRIAWRRARPADAAADGDTFVF
jgi:hypothetical protein